MPDQVSIKFQADIADALVKVRQLNSEMSKLNGTGGVSLINGKSDESKADSTKKLVQATKQATAAQQQGNEAIRETVSLRNKESMALEKRVRQLQRMQKENGDLSKLRGSMGEASINDQVTKGLEDIDKAAKKTSPNLLKLGSSVAALGGSFAGLPPQVNAALHFMQKFKIDGLGTGYILAGIAALTTLVSTLKDVSENYEKASKAAKEFITTQHDEESKAVEKGASLAEKMRKRGLSAGTGDVNSLQGKIASVAKTAGVTTDQATAVVLAAPDRSVADLSLAAGTLAGSDTLVGKQQGEMFNKLSSLGMGSQAVNMLLGMTDKQKIAEANAAAAGGPLGAQAQKDALDLRAIPDTERFSSQEKAMRVHELNLKNANMLDEQEWFGMRWLRSAREGLINSGVVNRNDNAGTSRAYKENQAFINGNNNTVYNAGRAVDAGSPTRKH